MILSLSNPVLPPKQQVSFVRKAESSVFFRRLKYYATTDTRYLNSRKLGFFRRLKYYAATDTRYLNSRKLVFGIGYSGTSVVSASRYEGLWEDPDDGSDDSEFEDSDNDDDVEMEENDLDYESDWEENGNARALVRNVEEPSISKSDDEDLVKEVEQLLSPEERAILEQNEAPNLEKLSTAKWKPLHSFALAAQIKFMDVLIADGYDIDQVDKDGLTALHLAIIGKREAVISHLLRKGANPQAKDKDGATPLHYAAQVGAMQTVKLLIKYKVDVNATDIEGWTPLHVAMQTRNRDIVKILLVNGADRMRRNKVGHTPLDMSLCYGKDFKSYDLAKLLKQVPVSC